MFLVKNIIPYIVKPLAHICNASLMNGIFPDRMKIARAIPLFKNGDVKEFSNYRPVSILPQFSKILEKVFHNRLMSFINDKQILNNSQFCFRKNMNKALAIIELVEALTYIIYWTKHSRNDPSAEVQGAAVTCYIPTGRRHDPALL